MMGEGRTRCINTCCKRTAPADKFPGEMICGKCFRSLPQQTRQERLGFWREIRKWERRITKTTDELKRSRMITIRNQWSDRLGNHWELKIKAFINSPEKPAGLDSFLEEMGL